MPLSPKSEDPELYQHLPQVITAMPRSQPTHAYNAPHTHVRGQLLYAISGLMRVDTDHGRWFIPPRRALWIPAGVVHDQLMLSPVQMRTLYIDMNVAQDLGAHCRVLEVSVLLRELILALIAEPVAYNPEGRNGHVVALILSELQRARACALVLPWPRDRRLIAVCNALLAAPGHTQTVEYWADKVGASPRTLIRLFIKETGLTYRQWLQQMRLTEALNRLETGAAIAPLAHALGYASASAFSAMFRSLLGESPREYLARNAG